MESLEGPPIRPLDDVVREHVEAVIASHFPRVPQYRIALELGISPTTLIRMRRKWAGGESVIRDRR
jgi:hypothetical protein